MCETGFVGRLFASCYRPASVAAAEAGLQSALLEADAAIEHGIAHAPGQAVANKRTVAAFGLPVVANESLSVGVKQYQVGPCANA